MQTTSRKGQSFQLGKLSPKIVKKITDDYLVGFIDGEGCFYVGIFPRPGTKFGWQITPEFKVSQNPRGKLILDTLKKRLNCGKIRPNDYQKKSDRTLVFVVRSHQDLWQKVIPFFRKNPIQSGKRRDLEKFIHVIKLIHQGKHLTKKGFVEILDLAYSMNTRKRKLPRSEIIASIKDK